jgi:Leucine-rich repeat (LRR) protein
MKGVMEAVAGLTNLRSLGITTCSFSHIPAAFTALVRLTHLDLTDTTVTSEGLECLGDITGLREVQLSNCFHLERLPGSFAKLTGLETLTLGRTAFSALPEFFTALPQLRKLSWSSAGFRAAPPMYLESVWCLTGLQQLVFEESTIASLPPGISRLTGLTGLLVQAERLMEPPTTLSALVGLERLGIYAPRLVALPEAITALTKLTRIELLCDPREPLSPDVAAFVQPRRWSPSEDDA